MRRGHRRACYEALLRWPSMTRIDFYIMQASTEQERMQLSVRLCEKAFRQSMKVMLLTADADAEQQVSELLWQYRPESFLPHMGAAAADVHTPIVVSSGSDHPLQHDFLINLTEQVPAMFSRFTRLAEIVVQTPHTLAATRRNFAYYKARGYPVVTHNL